jgi:hypothetical protein
MPNLAAILNLARALVQLIHQADSIEDVAKWGAFPTSSSRILDCSMQLCIKLLRTLPTKEIKVFHSSSQVGLAYMVVGMLKRKKRDYFRQVTLVVERLVTSIFDPKSHFFLKFYGLS